VKRTEEEALSSEIEATEHRLKALRRLRDMVIGKNQAGPPKKSL
jgi:hypothetical protein